MSVKRLDTRGQLSTPTAPSRRRLALTLLVVIALILVGALTFGVLLLRNPSCGTDNACFFAKAAQCRPARLLIEEARGSAVLVEKECVITKTIISLNTAVPAMENFLVGRSMQCPHAQGLVPPDVFSSITSGTSICYGPLADALYSLKEVAAPLEETLA